MKFASLLLLSVLLTQVTWAQSIGFKADRQTIALYKCDQTRGNLLTDHSGNNNTGTVYGATVGTGIIAGCLQFDGKNDYVDLSTGLNLHDKDFTIEMWVNITDTTDGRMDLLSCLLPNHPGGYMISYRHQKFQLYINENGTGYHTSAGRASMGKWHYVAVTLKTTMKGSEMKIYLDGQLLSTAKAKRPGPMPISLKLGAGGNQKDYKFFTGLIDEIRFSKVARSGNSIRRYYRKVEKVLGE